jgi:NlpC/P60 family putative phage cell wall peptidase
MSEPLQQSTELPGLSLRAGAGDGTVEEQRARVLDQARGWLGTPYHHRGRVKGAGVDCLMLLAEVYEAAGIIEHVEPAPYPRDWMLHRTDELYLGGLEQYAHEVDAPGPGDVALFRFGLCYSHAAIVVDWPQVIHAFAKERGVVLGDATIGALAVRDRKVRFFSVWG